ncbi:hypothetical protein ACFYUH_34800 [Streptomyces fimicarius]|uniref:hypothetical protein n=1 Tax=Streptomyces griseus TaxID=1911 RepID=UPI0036B28E56
MTTKTGSPSPSGPLYLWYLSVQTSSAIVATASAMLEQAEAGAEQPGGEPGGGWCSSPFGPRLGGVEEEGESDAEEHRHEDPGHGHRFGCRRPSGVEEMSQDGIGAQRADLCSAVRVASRIPLRQNRRSDAEGRDRPEHGDGLPDSKKIVDRRPGASGQ